MTPPRPATSGRPAMSRAARGRGLSGAGLSPRGPASDARKAAAARTRLRGMADPGDAAVLRRFFKTGPGEYGEGDRFLGVRVPAVRKLAREFEHMPRREIVRLLRSRFHEERLLALLIMVRRFERGDEAQQKWIYGLYLENTRQVNNWDLVDLTAAHIVGAYLKEKPTQPLHDLARSELLWERRIAIVATFYFIRRSDFGPTLTVAGLLLSDTEDLIHKAAGWMLREVGKRDMAAEEEFLRRHCREMPRTMLRYAIEKFPERKRLKYLNGSV